MAWIPSSIIDETNRYVVQLTGSGKADVTIRRIQKLIHLPGTRYQLRINGKQSGTIEANALGVVTIPKVEANALLELKVEGMETGSIRLHNKTNFKQPLSYFSLFNKAFYWEPHKTLDILGRQ